jgi:hypothetical protein
MELETLVLCADVALAHVSEGDRDGVRVANVEFDDPDGLRVTTLPLSALASEWPTDSGRIVMGGVHTYRVSLDILSPMLRAEAFKQQELLQAVFSGKYDEAERLFSSIERGEHRIGDDALVTSFPGLEEVMQHASEAEVRVGSEGLAVRVPGLRRGVLARQASRCEDGGGRARFCSPASTSVCGGCGQRSGKPRRLRS